MQATVVKTIEIVQGRTLRWGLAWSLLPASRMTMQSQKIEMNNLSLDGVSCKLGAASFDVDVCHCYEGTNQFVDVILKSETHSLSDRVG
ncbi:hypothetical protein CASFOL_042039 [Castilleja foliolosa]|uniref:Uncharacterized protein n=1 Tax=Castilleja foliolosa TaxID=1961234 RepID=A0ABD3B9D0_9LAMI